MDSQKELSKLRNFKLTNKSKAIDNHDTFFDSLFVTMILILQTSNFNHSTASKQIETKSSIFNSCDVMYRCFFKYQNEKRTKSQQNAVVEFLGSSWLTGIFNFGTELNSVMSFSCLLSISYAKLQNGYHQSWNLAPFPNSALQLQ